MARPLPRELYQVTREAYVSLLLANMAVANNDDTAFFVEAVDEGAILKGYDLVPWDIVVFNNASIHHYQEAERLEDWLWTRFRIVIIFLPTRLPL
jgi:hypothetical protein